MHGLDGKTYNIKWSKSKYETWNICKRQGAYKYLFHHEYKINSAIALGLLFHARAEEFWYPFDYKTKIRRGQPKLDLWPDAETFAEATYGMWKMVVRFHNEGRPHYQKVAWRDPAEPYWMEKDIKAAAKLMYNFFSKMERPFQIEFTFPTVVVEGVILSGRADFLSKPLILDDLKSKRYPTPLSELKYDPQFTVYETILSLMGTNPEYHGFAVEWGVSSDQFKALREDPLALVGKIKSRQIWLPTDSKQEQKEVKYLEAPPRERERVVNFLQNTWNLEEIIASGNYVAEEGKHCEWCPFYARCQEDTKNNIETRFPQQHSFLTAVKESKPKEINSSQLRIKWPKQEESKSSQQKLFG